jgi:purine-binding chemotaxis protein CheW
VPRLLLFRAAGQTCACQLDLVREIIPYRRPTRVPGAPAFVTGIVNLRGSLITVLDLGVRLGDSRIDPARGSIVLVDHGARGVGLAVDELQDVQRVPQGAIEAVQPDGGQDGAIAGVFRAGNAFALVLDVPSIVRRTLG